MAAPTNAAYVKKALANSEPSTHGTSRQISSREFTVGIGWKADIGRQVVSAKPVAIDPLRNSLVQCHHTFRVHHGGHCSLADLSEFGYPVPYEPSTHFQTWVSQESMSKVEARESVSVGC